MSATPAEPSAELRRWVNEVGELTTPSEVLWIDGSPEQAERLVRECLKTGELIELDQQKLPGCYLHRSAPHDVARTEDLTFISTDNEHDAGPNNNWMHPDVAASKYEELFGGVMTGRTMYVIPFLMGPRDSRFAQAGVQLTDSRYVALSMRLMTRVGDIALEHIAATAQFTRCVHSVGDFSPDRRFIVHAPHANTVWSIGSGYGGNALLAKKCMALRLSSWNARHEGWLAEHMLLLGIEEPSGRVSYVAGAFPAACGKTNLAMLEPPASMPGWKVWTVGDDIAWLRPSTDGRLRAVNPEAGFFGVIPGTSRKSNPVAFDMIQRDTIYTNVALRPDGTPWWEGHDDPPPAEAIDWQGRPWTPASGTLAAHPNSRFTAPMRNCRSLSPQVDDPDGVPLDAIIFGARRTRDVPLVYQAFDWEHGTFLGATMLSETADAAASHAAGVLRRDPMAMLPFCGYNMGDYFRHWIDIGKHLTRPPQIFRVNWFRADAQGFLWPGFRENLRVLAWVVARCHGAGEAVETPIGHVPSDTAIDCTGLNISDGAMEALMDVDAETWLRTVESHRVFFDGFEDRVPEELRDEANRLALRLRHALVVTTRPDLRAWLFGSPHDDPA